MRNGLMIDEDGNKHYFLNDILHRVDGPAVECADGDKEWYLNGSRHRVEEPAVEWADGDKSWYLNGKNYTEDQYNNYMMIENFKLL